MDLQYAELSGIDLTNADFEDSDLDSRRLLLRHADRRDLTRTDLSGGKLIAAALAGTKLDDAIISGADLTSTTGGGLTKRTALFHGQLQGERPARSRAGDQRSGRMELRGTEPLASQLQRRRGRCRLTDAVITGGSFQGVTSFGFAKEQFYGTASYKAGNLEGVVLTGNNLAGWDFGGQNLRYAGLQAVSLSGADLAGADLANADLQQSSLTSANFAGASLKNAYMFAAYWFTPAMFDGNVYNQWTCSGRFQRSRRGPDAGGVSGR